MTPLSFSEQVLHYPVSTPTSISPRSLEIVQLALKTLLLPLAATASVLWNGLGAACHYQDSEKTALFAKALFTDLEAAAPACALFSAAVYFRSKTVFAVSFCGLTWYNQPVTENAAKKIPEAPMASAIVITPDIPLKESSESIKKPDIPRDEEKPDIPEDDKKPDIPKEETQRPPAETGGSGANPDRLLFFRDEETLDKEIAAMRTEITRNLAELHKDRAKVQQIFKESYLHFYARFVEFIFLNRNALLMQIKGHIPEIVWDGHKIAGQLEQAKSDLLDEETKKQLDECIENLRWVQGEIADAQKSYLREGGKEALTLDWHPMLPAFRTGYAYVIGQLEFDLLHLMITLNSQIDSWSTQGVHCVKLDYTFPLDGMKIVERVTTITRNYGRVQLKNSLPWLVQISADAAKFQKRINAYRAADAYIMNFKKGDARWSSELEQQIRRPQPRSFLEIDKVLPGLEMEIARMTARTNHLLTVYGAGHTPIPYTVPLDTGVVIRKLQYIRTQTTETQEIDDIISIVQRNQQLIEILRKTLTSPPKLFGKEKIYKKLYEGEMVKDLMQILAEYQFEAATTSTNAGYIAFKNQIRAAQQMKDQSGLNPLDFFGQDIKNEEELKKARKKVDMVLHPDKNGDTDEAKRLFQCMKDLYELCLLLL